MLTSVNGITLSTMHCTASVLPDRSSKLQAGWEAKRQLVSRGQTHFLPPFFHYDVIGRQDDDDDVIMKKMEAGNGSGPARLKDN